MARRGKGNDDGPGLVQDVMTILVGKWKAAIIYHRERNDWLRFGGRRRVIPEVAQGMLTRQHRCTSSSATGSSIASSTRKPRLGSRTASPGTARPSRTSSRPSATGAWITWQMCGSVRRATRRRPAGSNPRGRDGDGPGTWGSRPLPQCDSPRSDSARSRARMGRVACECPVTAPVATTGGCLETHDPVRARSFFCSVVSAVQGQR